MGRVLCCLGSLSFVSGKIYFSETFDDAWESRWVKSQWKDSEGTAGKWALSAGKWFKDEAEDKGLQTAEDSKFFGISAAFDSFSNDGKDLIVQYQAKYEKDVECGGGYLKLGPKMDDQTKFGDPTVYNIMFGPDKCGYTKRTHLIFQYKGKNVLKKSDLDYKQDGEGTSHLYRLVLKPDNTVRVEIDEEKIYEGNLKDDWEVLKPKKIDDPEDKKPSDWVEDSMMDDPEDKKPDDWVEEKRIVDAAAKKPDDWDDEEDGEWEAPMIDNPDYHGDWSVKRISNPAYKGFWEAKKIDNPEYEDDNTVYKYADFGFIGFEKAEKKKADEAKKEDDKKKEDEADDDDDDAEDKTESEDM